jgi:hypothetical protein
MFLLGHVLNIKDCRDAKLLFSFYSILNFVSAFAKLQTDTIDSVLRHRNVSRAKDLLAPHCICPMHTER